MKGDRGTNLIRIAEQAASGAGIAPGIQGPGRELVERPAGPGALASGVLLPVRVLREPHGQLPLTVTQLVAAFGVDVVGEDTEGVSGTEEVLREAAARIRQRPSKPRGRRNAGWWIRTTAVWS